MINTLQASLTVRGGPNSGMTVNLTKRPITLGRRYDCDVVVDEPTVSRLHALIMETQGGFVIRDLNTTNGTYVNRDRVGQGEQPLRNGDKVRLAGSQIVVTFVTEGKNTVKMDAVPMFTSPIEEQIVSVKAKPEIEPAWSAKDASFLRYMESRRSEVVSREELVRQVWPELPVGENVDATIDEAVGRLRVHIGDDPLKPGHLITVGEFGYLLM